ncbi:MAG TPA: hypothetical protein V6D22_10300, partial [Candidatus Obscuribacterales bacterium]
CSRYFATVFRDKPNSSAIHFLLFPCRKCSTRIECHTSSSIINAQGFLDLTFGDATIIPGVLKVLKFRLPLSRNLLSFSLPKTGI